MAIQYKDGYKYVLDKDYTVQIPIHPKKNVITQFVSLSTTGRLVIRKGYAWDGASGCPDYKSIMRGSLVHDVLYQLMRNGKLDRNQRKPADKLLREMCKEDGMNRWMAKVVYLAVQKYGNPYTKYENRKKVLTAP